MDQAIRSKDSPKFFTEINVSKNNDDFTTKMIENDKLMQHKFDKTKDNVQLS